MIGKLRLWATLVAMLTAVAGCSGSAGSAGRATGSAAGASPSGGSTAPSVTPTSAPSSSSSSSPSVQPLTVAPATSLAGVVLGVDTPVSNDARVVSELGRPPDAIDGFYSWKDPFPSQFVSDVAGMGSTPMITWLPASGDVRHGNISGYTLSQVTSGAADGYITPWADAARAFGRPILVRLMHEMNGNWYPWGAGVDGNTPEEYVAAFRHVVTVVRQAGATNVQFVWCVATSAASTLGKTSATPISAFFPGDAYVSWVAMDGYSRKSGRPRPFSTIFSGVYSQLTSLSSRPVMVAETGVVTDPTNPSYKAEWISSGLAAVPTEFPRMKAVFYFDSRGNGFSYPFDGDPAATSALSQLLAEATFEAKVPAATLSY